MTIIFSWIRSLCRFVGKKRDVIVRRRRDVRHCSLDNAYAEPDLHPSANAERKPFGGSSALWWRYNLFHRLFKCLQEGKEIELGNFLCINGYQMRIGRCYQPYLLNHCVDLSHSNNARGFRRTNSTKQGIIIVLRF